MKTKTNENFTSHFRGSQGFFALFLLLVILSGCHFPASPIPPDSRIFENVSELATNSVIVDFQLELPEPISEKLVVEILDDVTGLSFNSKFYELKAASDQVYAARLSVPAGSVLKYRYGLIGQPFTPEATADGNPVAFRLLYVPASITIIDYLQAWTGGVRPGIIGRLKGTLLDKSSNLPIPDILVSAGGLRTFTDANGKFVLEGLSEGIHNVVFYAIDGRYQTYQQGAAIKPGMNTLANVGLNPMPAVNITFKVNPPVEAQGAPIHLAGNILQLGNTFNDSMSIQPKRMPILTQNEDGSLEITLQLFAETDLRYKFTLGDGYWNAEQHESGGFRIRQLIVPYEDATIFQTIDTWGSANVEPITFLVSIPPETTPQDEKFIQFRTDQWLEPIPLWPLGDGNFLYILFSPLDPSRPVQYQFCRNADCLRARDSGSLSFVREVHPSTIAQKINLTLDSWQNWYPLDKAGFVQDAYVPPKPLSYQRMIELTPQMDPSWLAYAPAGIAALSGSGVDTVILAPQWAITPNSPYLRPVLGLTPLNREVVSMLNFTNAQGLSAGIFPQLGLHNEIENWWNATPHTEAWWNTFFSSYRDFVIGYAKLAQISEAEYLFIGGKFLLPAFEGGLYPDGSESSVPLGFDNHWMDLLADLRSSYNGKIFWATNANLEMDPLPFFIDELDGIYLSIDSPLALGDDPSFEVIQAGFTTIIDNEIYEVYRSTGMPVILALAYPAVEIAASGCALLNATCYNDGLFRASEISSYAISFTEQALIYNAVMPIIASRDWITGTSIRGYEPTGIILDGGSSIAGKPAFDVLQYWFTSMKP
jgi:hypothetical protein